MKHEIKNLVWLLALTIVLVFPSACSAIFEEDIEEEEVFLLAPLDGETTTSVNLLFWWEQVDGAERYHLQIAEPSFGFIKKLVVDSNLTENKYQARLYPGSFEWRVSAYNSGYATPYAYATLQIDSTTSLVNQEVVLISPDQDEAINTMSVEFTWYPIYIADDYRIEIRKENWEGQLALNPRILPETSFSTELEEGKYAWGVQAQNSSGSSTLFSVNEFMVDTTPPRKPVLLSPGNGEELSGSSVKFEWNRPADSGSSLLDSIYVVQDTIFNTNNIVYKDFVADTGKTREFDSGGDYVWRVISIDKAGNKSDFSERKFYIQEQLK